MSKPAGKNTRDQRPEFMAVLGLSPPYSADDVKQAYFHRARQLHPDHGGSARDFQQLHEAFEQAQQYVAYRGDRRGWIAARMTDYVAVQEAIERLEAIGAKVTSTTTDWIQKSIGDFAQLTETIAVVRLVDSPRGDELLTALAQLRPALKGLAAVELPGCHLSDRSVQLLVVFQELRRLDLSGTPATAASLSVIDAIPTLESVALGGSRVGWWAHRAAQAKLKRRTVGKF